MSREAAFDKFLLIYYLVCSLSSSSQLGIAIDMTFNCLVFCRGPPSYQSNKTERSVNADKLIYIRNNEFKFHRSVMLLEQNIQKLFVLFIRTLRPVFIGHLFVAERNAVENRLTFYLGLKANSLIVNQLKRCVLDSLRSILNSGC